MDASHSYFIYIYIYIYAKILVLQEKVAQLLEQGNIDEEYEDLRCYLNRGQTREVGCTWKGRNTTLVSKENNS